MQISPRSLVGD